jgi:hypothetical protein
MALSVIGKMISLGIGIDPTNVYGHKDFVPCLSQMIEGCKSRPKNTNLLPIKVDVPQLLAEQGLTEGASPLVSAVGDLTLIAFYSLLRIGK